MEDWIELGEFYADDIIVKIETIFNDHKIEFRIRDQSTHLNSAFGQQSVQPVVVFVHEQDFEKASALIDGISSDDDTAETDIEKYSDDELNDIVLNPDEWHPSVVENAKKILQSKGIAVDEKKIRDSVAEKIRKLEEGEDIKPIIIFIYWFLAIMGGMLGIIGGYYLWKGKTTGFNGEKYFIYNSGKRRIGYYIFLAGIASAFFQILLLCALR